MTIKDPLETETARLLPSSRTDPRTFFWDFTPSWRYILAILLAFVVLFALSGPCLLPLAPAAALVIDTHLVCGVCVCRRGTARRGTGGVRS